MDQQKFFNILAANGITAERAAAIICRLDSVFEHKDKKMVEIENETTDNMMSVESLSQKITRLLTAWGFSSNLLGFNYLRSSIMYLVLNGTDISITRTLYPSVAEEFKSTPGRVERAIRHSIDRVFDYHNSSLLKLMGETIDCRKGKPTNSELIAFVAEQIRSDLL